MVTIKIIVVIALLLSALPGTSETLRADKKSGGIAQSGSGLSQHPPDYDLWVGWMLGGSLTGGCSVFIGTIQELYSPDQQAESERPSILFYSKVRVTVDEWLYGEPQQLRAVLKLNRVPFLKGPVINSESLESRWKDVELRVGSKLLVAFDPGRVKNQEPLKEIDRYHLAVSDTSLFGAIRATLANHARYIKNLDEISDAPSVLNAQSDRVFAGYLMNYLRRIEGENHTDTLVIMLSQLIGNSHFAEEAWRLFEAPLMRMMSNNDNPVSEATRNQVTQVLVTSSCSDKAAQAKSALRILVTLSDSNDVNIKPLLTQGCRAKIIKNYRDLILPDSIDKGQSAFESQLGMRPN